MSRHRIMNLNTVGHSEPGQGTTAQIACTCSESVSEITAQISQQPLHYLTIEGITIAHTRNKLLIKTC